MATSDPVRTPDLGRVGRARIRHVGEIADEQRHDRAGDHADGERIADGVIVLPTRLPGAPSHRVDGSATAPPPTARGSPSTCADAARCCSAPARPPLDAAYP
jgi:hypothetical protein